MHIKIDVVIRGQHMSGVAGDSAWIWVSGLYLRHGPSVNSGWFCCYQTRRRRCEKAASKAWLAKKCSASRELSRLRPLISKTTFEILHSKLFSEPQALVVGYRLNLRSGMDLAA